MACGGLMSAPVCLIENDENGKLHVRKEAKNILDGIIQPVVVVSVVGLYRTGKSYLMNRLAGQQSGFALGSANESKTKGIWMWCIPHPKKEGHTLVLLDTEGLGDVAKGDEKHDTWIFCLAVLLSSTLVYNSLGTIDNTALENLHYVTELTENICVKADVGQHEDESADFIRVFPSFVWTVRDFTLELKRGDKLITSDEYLEGALKLKPGISHRIEQYNLPRRCLRQFFAVRKCFVFPRPASTQNMQRMEQLTEKELDSGFLEQADTFCSYVYDNSEPKTVTGGRTITGTALGNLAEVYVEAIRSGNVLCVENAVTCLAKIQNVRAVEEALQFYMTEMLSIAELPKRPEELSDIHKTAEKKAIEVFFSISFNDNGQIYQQELMRKIHDEYQQRCQQNQEASRMQCEDVLRDVFDKMEKSISDGSYLKPGGYQQYRDTLTQLTWDYRARTDSQIMREDVLIKYLRAKEEIGIGILQADQSMNATERESEVHRLKCDILKKGQRAVEKQKWLHERVFEDMKRSHQEHMRQTTSQMERELERFRKDNERVLEAKLKERGALLQQNFQQEAARIQDEINSLKADMNKQEMSHHSLQYIDTKWPGAGLSKLVWTKGAQSDESQFPLQRSEEKGSDSLSYSSLEAQSPAHPSEDAEVAEVFTPELVQRGDEDKHDNTYRFVCPHAGQFRCSLTNLVFVMEGEGEVLYNIDSWDPRLLDGLGQMQPAGPLYNIDCFNGSISGLHFPHCEIFSEENKDILAVAHLTGGNVETMKPLKVTETHVMIYIKDLSLFGLLKRKIFSSFPVVAQVLLFLRPITTRQRENILDVYLLPWNIPLSKVMGQHKESTHITTSSKCSLTPGSEYGLCCEPVGSTVQPETEKFECNFGPNYHPTFEVFVNFNTEEIRLSLLDKTEGKEVWVTRRVVLT
ncbi:guanylate-binding protein 1 isoform X2 [Labeo rohita]|uniref:guanylate-binding protein 1 isoform X2 n=1 Tax=Labeo rohita TaxID=84645 RepID=UPI0021E1F07E|nr:guanylate-binding protein 1 isoform X2 [Labeo rohita]